MALLQLRDDVRLYVHRNDITNAQLNSAIDKATKRLGRELRSGENEREVIFNMSQNPMALPADFRGIRAMTYGANGGLQFVRSGNLRTMALLSGQRAGSNPVFYAVEGRAIRTAPTRLGDYNLLYWYEPPALVNDTDTNAVLDSYPQLYLYAALMELFFMIQDAEMYAGAKNEYQEYLRQVNINNEQQRLGAAPAMRAI